MATAPVSWAAHQAEGAQGGVWLRSHDTYARQLPKLATTTHGLHPVLAGNDGGRPGWPSSLLLPAPVCSCFNAPSAIRVGWAKPMASHYENNLTAGVWYNYSIPALELSDTNTVRVRGGGWAGERHVPPHVSYGWQGQLTTGEMA